MGKIIIKIIPPPATPLTNKDISVTVTDPSNLVNNVTLDTSLGQDFFVSTAGKYMITVKTSTQEMSRSIDMNTTDDKSATFNLDLQLASFVTVSPITVDIDNDTPLNVNITPTATKPTPSIPFWKVIKTNLDPANFRGTGKPFFTYYLEYIESIFKQPLSPGGMDKRLPYHRSEGYSLLKYATEEFVLAAMSFSANPNSYFPRNTTPYYELVQSTIRNFFPAPTISRTGSAPTGEGYITPDLDGFLIELIWSYWDEESMLVQTMMAITRRFQNMRSGPNDPLANFELDPLRPLNNILWGYIQDTQNRLTIQRRAHEYEHHYGLGLVGTAVANVVPADRRSKFLQAFHRLLYECVIYFSQKDNKIIEADGFKVLNALRDTHRILAEGAHNQFGDLPFVARVEMLIEQWILSRTEIREFLHGRTMVAYEEPWMEKVDTMKTLQGWDNTSVSFYHDLAVYGEKIILGVRYGNWTAINDTDEAKNWANEFRDAIQRYIHSYYTVTGVDIAANNVSISQEEKYQLPGMLIQQKFKKEKLLR